MKISKMNKTKRQGVSVVNILAGLALLAITAAVVGPRFVDAKKPGYISNLKQEISNVEDYISNYAILNEGSYDDINFKKLVDINVITGTEVSKITGTGVTSVYKPRWAEDEVTMKIFPTDDNKNVIMEITVNGSSVIDSTWDKDFETDIEKYVVRKWGADAFDAKATSDATTFTASVANTAGVANADANGEFMFKVQ